MPGLDGWVETSGRTPAKEKSHDAMFSVQHPVHGKVVKEILA